MHRATFRAMSCTLSLIVLAACNNDGRTLDPPIQTTMPIASTSSTVATTATGVPAGFNATGPWAPAGEIPLRYGCDGEGLSPSLTWTGVPEGTNAFAVVAVDSTDIRDDGTESILWVAAGIPADALGVSEGALPDGSVEGMNAIGGVGWVAPCPPSGQTHRIDLTVYALVSMDGITSGMSGNDMRGAIIAAAIDESSFSGTYTAP